MTARGPLPPSQRLVRRPTGDRRPANSKLLWWMRAGEKVTMRRDGRWFVLATGAVSSPQPRFTLVYTIRSVVTDGREVLLALAEFDGAHLWDATRFRPVRPLAAGEGIAGMAVLADIAAGSETMAITLSEFEGWG